MAKAKVLITRAIPEEGMRVLNGQYNLDVWPEELPPTRDALLQRVQGVAGVLSLLTDKINAEVMDAAGAGLKVISNYAVGFDNVDIPEATKRGIPVGNTPGVLDHTTADCAFMLLMAAARRVVEGDRYVRAGKWKTWGPQLLLGRDIHGATLGIIGLGRIGKEMARRARGFDMRVLYYDPYCQRADAGDQVGAQCADLDTLLRESDFVSLHVPLTPDTRHLINAESLAKMKSSAVLINTARGPIVDTNALYQALKNQVIGYAGLDVTDPEPLPGDHPLLTLDNVIVVPHIASASVATRGKMARMAVENLIAGLQGERLPNCVNPQVYNN